MQARAVEWKARHDRIEVEVQRQREAFERRIADLEIVNDQLQQERYVSFTDCVSGCHVARSCYFHASLLYPEVQRMTELLCFILVRV